MKRSKTAVAALAFALAGCATSLIGKETQALEAVTQARVLATANLRAGKITAEEDLKIQTQATLLRSSIEAAVKANDQVAFAKAEADAKALKAQQEEKK